MELTIEQLLIVGFVGSIVAQGIKLVTAYFGYELSRFWISAIVMVLSFCGAWIWFPVPLPTEVADPMLFVQAWLGVILTIFGSAVLVYNILLEKVFEKLSLTKERALVKFQ